MRGRRTTLGGSRPRSKAPHLNLGTKTVIAIPFLFLFGRVVIETAKKRQIHYRITGDKRDLVRRKLG